MKKVISILFFWMMLYAISPAQTYNDFTLPDVDGTDVSFSSSLEKSKVILIGFWASWCTPCKEEMKKIQDIYEKYKDKGFEYFAINVDNQKSVAKVSAFVKAQGFTFKVLMDTDKRVFETYGGKDEMPYSLMINKNKEVLSVHTGFKSGDEFKIEEEIKSALGL